MSINPYESPESHASPSEPPRAGHTGTILRIVLGVLALGLVVALLLPARRVAGEAARKGQCVNNLRQISLALLNYRDTFHTFPPAYTQDATGRRLHSWRTMILPYMEQAAVHKRVKWGKPWDDPANQAVRETPMSP